MRFNFICTVICCLNAISASAQPTLTAATTMPTVGLRSKVYNSNGFNPGTAGANQTWDVSAMSFSSSAFGSHQACNAANGCTNYPGATIAYSYSGTYIYYGASTNALGIYGYFNGGSANYYSNAEDYLRFPITYGNSYVDTFASSYGGTGGTWYRKGIDSVSADGWGSIKTPAGTFPNALRIKTVSTYKDTGIIMGLPDYIAYKGTTYTWYDVTHKDFLYATATLTITPKSSAPQVLSFARYTDNQTLAVEPAVKEGLLCHIVPNPARGRVQITISLDASARAVVSLTDITGRVVRNLPAVDLVAGENKVSLPTEGLPGGVYSLRIMAGNAVVGMKVVIE